jgi:hypothetical protein
VLNYWTDCRKVGDRGFRALHLSRASHSPTVSRSQHAGTKRFLITASPVARVRDLTSGGGRSDRQEEGFPLHKSGGHASSPRGAAGISRRISELEAHLRTRLLNRTTRRLTLKDAGAAYLAACRRILEQVDRGGAGGRWRVPGPTRRVDPHGADGARVCPRRPRVHGGLSRRQAQPAPERPVLDLQEEHVDVPFALASCRTAPCSRARLASYDGSFAPAPTTSRAMAETG